MTALTRGGSPAGDVGRSFYPAPLAASRVAAGAPPRSPCSTLHPMLRTLLSLLLFVAAAASQITGTVANGTTHQPAAGVAVSLVAFQSGVAPAASTRTDAGGHFHFAQSPAPNSPTMLRADYRGVSYFETLPAGQSAAQLQVYEVSGDAGQLRLAARVTVVQPEQGQLAVVDEYVVDNHLNRTLYRKGGLFRFRIQRGVPPDGARVIGPSGMPITRNAQTTASPGVYTLDYPIRPGETRFQVSYRLPYATQQAQITDDTVLPVDHLRVYVPPPMKFDGAGFNALASEDGYQVYEARSAAGPVIFSVAGTAPLPSEMQAGAGASGADTGGAQAGPAPAATGIVPPKTWMEQNGYGVLAVLLILAATGFGYLLTRPQAAAAAGADAQASAPARPPQPALAPAADGVNAQLARLKDDLFLLEVQRHTGHLEEAQYQQARQALDQRMRALAEGLKVGD